jgi:hypothetical protein
MAGQPPDVFLKAAMNIAAVDFFTVLNRFDTDALIKRLHEKPELYFPFINSFANLMKANLDQKKLEFKQKQAEAKQRDRDQKLRARKPILLTDTTLESFGRTLARSRRREEADSDPKAPIPPVTPPSTIQHLPANRLSRSPNNPPIHSSPGDGPLTTDNEPLTTDSAPSADPTIQQSNNPAIHSASPPTNTNTTNTGSSEFVEFNALNHTTESKPETQPIPTPTPTFDDDSWHDPVYQHSDNLVCSPS